MNPSIVSSIAAIAVGESYARAEFIPAARYSADIVLDAKTRLRNTLTTAVARVRNKDKYARFRVNATQAFTDALDVVAIGVVTREPDEL